MVTLELSVKDAMLTVSVTNQGTTSSYTSLYFTFLLEHKLGHHIFIREWLIHIQRFEITSHNHILMAIISGDSAGGLIYIREHSMKEAVLFQHSSAMYQVFLHKYFPNIISQLWWTINTCLVVFNLFLLTTVFTSKVFILDDF